MECVVCRLEAQHHDTYGDIVEAECKRCGRYKYSGSVFPTLSSDRLVPQQQRPIIAGWIWAQNRAGNVPTINTTNISNLTSLRPQSFLEKAKRLLLYMADNTQRLGDLLKVFVPSVGGMLETFDNEEIKFIAGFLCDEKLADRIESGFLLRVTPKGFLKADEWRTQTSTGSQGFVAMWFDETTESAWTNGLEKGIGGAGYSALRINMKEHTNKICDEIISEIRRSRFVVADFTGQRGGVYFEAGFAAGRDIPVIWSCRKDHMKELHFDIRQYNCIDWEEPAELGRRLKARIEAVIGDGPLKN